MAENWGSYLCNVNFVLASIALDLDLHRIAPDRTKLNSCGLGLYEIAP